MVIQLSPKIWEAALADDQTLQKEINRLLIRVADDWHKLYIDDLELVDKIIGSSIIANCYEMLLKKTSRKSIDRASTKPLLITQQNHIQNNKQASGVQTFWEEHLMVETQSDGNIVRFVAIEAIETYLCEPLEILLENASYDECFLRNIFNLVIKHNALQQPTFEELKQQRRIKVEHGGGSSIRSELERRKHPVRLVCLIDSDKKYPNDTQNASEINKHTTLCNEKQFQLWVLSNREIENYLPDKVLSQWLQEISFLYEHDYFKAQFSAEQKRYFDMKKGIKPNDFNDPNIQKLYKH